MTDSAPAKKTTTRKTATKPKEVETKEVTAAENFLPVDEQNNEQPPAGDTDALTTDPDLDTNLEINTDPLPKPDKEEVVADDAVQANGNGDEVGESTIESDVEHDAPTGQLEVTYAPLEQYTGTKTLNATPLSRGDYNTLRGWDVPADENPDDEGYLVEYVDSGESNHPDFTGYISWSPKHVFEKAYKASGSAEQRMVIERDELKAKLNKLTYFLSQPKPYYISPKQWQIKIDQKRAMTAYLSTLNASLELMAG